jgi:GNAT superfamily N-acetyltransferase
MWLRQYALIAQQADTARAYLIRPHGEQRVVGYYALAAGSIEPQDASDRLAAGAGRHPIPVIVLTRLGVDVRDQRRGLGAELMYDAFLQTAAVADRVGARALLIHAESPTAAAFYRRVDPAFEELPGDPLQVILLMKDLRGGIRKAAKREIGGG